MVSTKAVEHIADLAIGKDEAGRVNGRHDSEESLDRFGTELGKHTYQLTVTNTADCMEERRTTDQGGIIDPAVLRRRVVSQWPGGLVLATAKAAVAADAAYLRDARDFKDAYLKTFDLLTSLEYEDSGHAKCGASGLVEASAAEPVVREIALPTLSTIMEIDESRTQHFDSMFERKRQLARSGFYGTWDAGWHEDFLSQKAPHNFYHVKTEPDAVHGHYGKGVYVVTSVGEGFAKNAFFEDTGEMSFAVTPPKVLEVAQKIGGSDAEREAIIVAFAADLLDVSDKIVAPGMPVFAQAA